MRGVVGCRGVNFCSNMAGLCKMKVSLQDCVSGGLRGKKILNITILCIVALEL